MLPLIMAACGAVGAVVGAITTHATQEKNRQAVKRYKKVNADLIKKRNDLEKRYYELSDRSKQQVSDLNLKLAESEMEKDLVYLALSLYHELMVLREDIDINPSLEVLLEFRKAIILTNQVLQQLDKPLVPIYQDFFHRSLKRIEERDNLSKEQLLDFMAVLMDPQQENTIYFLQKLGKREKNRELVSTLGVKESSLRQRKGKSTDNPCRHKMEGNAQQNRRRNKRKQHQKNTNSSNNTAQYWYNQAKQLLDLRRYEEALNCCEQAITIEPNNEKYLELRERLIWRLKRNSSSVNTCSQLVIEEEARTEAIPSLEKTRVFICHQQGIDYNSNKSNAHQEFLENVQKIVIEQLGVAKSDVTPKASFADDLGADSLDQVELMMALEEEFDLEIPDKIAEQVNTVGEAVQLIAASSQGKNKVHT